MRIAVAGKGGAGKTTFTSTFARVAAQRGRTVVCIDADSNPNLGAALGIRDELPHALPLSLVSRRLDGGPALKVPIAEVVAEHTLAGPDGVRLAMMGMPQHADEGCMCSAHGVVRAALADLDGPDVVALVDMEASPEHFSRGTARHVDTMLFVAEPYFRSLETVRRMAELAKELPISRMGVIANKLRDEQDDDAVTAFCERHGIELIGRIRWDDAVLDADRDRTPLIEIAPDGPTVTSVREIFEAVTSPATAATGTAS